MGIPQKSRKGGRLILLHKCLRGKAMIPTDSLIPKIWRCRNRLSLAFQTPLRVHVQAAINVASFLKQGLEWPPWYSLISSAELSDDCMSKLTSLVRD